ncbi:P34-Arc-domain-containing protein [Rozella allomycis CSF55]|uniref:Arp2/3 complex 34 kDa subunit n=1 Tax=Rozella allomycis (strain CSF55) TaxID=988480 RepID=A0A075ARQ5_ROZAC|nr:ARP2/3 complex, 34kDa subunit (p34-Arc) domain-containing protein [Rozella allomycis CSF55]RKP18428.1 P34-Arc-domain-containing protein [Rozella allomycis CSF55]|eukprot:EPZ32860.1 ARP2/3 complex, 34kDa subunit (p34-Arc) domain-containing protein [Rozella allomycis CSF55]
MILLEYSNKVLEETLTAKFLSEKQESIDLRCADFDGVIYHVSTPNSKSELVVSISMKGFCQLEKYGSQEFLQKEYQGFIMDKPETGYDLSLCFNLEKNVSRDVSLLKSNCLAAPFDKAFKDQESGVKQGELMVIEYRDREAFFIQSFHDRVVHGCYSWQSVFANARKQLNLQNTPQVLYSKEPPLELKGVPNLGNDDNIGYVSFVLFPRHYTPGNRRTETIKLIQTFRDYLHYHIKCSKAYLHSRMRNKVNDFLKVLNRAKPEVVAEKKTASGRTFRQK